MTTVYTVGHSTRGADEFRQLLSEKRIQVLVDIRQFPVSKRFPHFSLEALAASLKEAGIDYVHEVSLGGRRASNPTSPNTYWRNPAFRAYADHMATAEFQAAIERVIELAEQQTAALMCAEFVPWRCHRWLIADVLVSRGFGVIHLLSLTDSQPHALNPNAQVDERGLLVYPGDPDPIDSATAGA
jgi:uncharacterized protein (DUF488 family)